MKIITYCIIIICFSISLGQLTPDQQAQLKPYSFQLMKRYNQI